MSELELKNKFYNKIVCENDVVLGEVTGIELDYDTVCFTIKDESFKFFKKYINLSKINTIKIKVDKVYNPNVVIPVEYYTSFDFGDDRYYKLDKDGYTIYDIKRLNNIVDTNFSSRRSSYTINRINRDENQELREKINKYLILEAVAISSGNTTYTWRVEINSKEVIIDRHDGNNLKLVTIGAGTPNAVALYDLERNVLKL